MEILHLDEDDDSFIPTEAQAAEFFASCPFVLEKDSDDTTDNSLSEAEYEMVLAEWRKRLPRRPLETDDVERIIGRALRRERRSGNSSSPCESLGIIELHRELPEQLAAESQKPET